MTQAGLSLVPVIRQRETPHWKLLPIQPRECVVKSKHSHMTTTLTLRVFVAWSDVQPVAAFTRFFGADKLANAVSIHISSLHRAVVIIYIPVHAIAIHLGKNKACVIREIHLAVLNCVYGGWTATENTCYRVRREELTPIYQSGNCGSIN